MRLLLDTHVWLWQLLDPERLSRRVAEALDSADHDLHLSPISVWETLVLVRKGRLEVPGDAPTWVREALGASPTQMVPVSHDIALRSEGLVGYSSPDPADRFLIATALVEDLTLITSDRRIREYAALRTLW